MKYRLIILCLLLFFPIINTIGDGRILTVATYEVSPFVDQSATGELSGYSINLLENLKKYLKEKVEYKYVLYPNMESSLNAVHSGEVDLGIGATVITSNREEMVDFSHSFLRTEIGILVPKNTILDNLKSILISSKVLYIILILIAYIFVCAHIIWLLERKSLKWSMHKGYIKGITHGAWWTISTMSTVGYGDVYPNRIIGKLFGSFVMFSGILIFSLSIATFTSVVTIKQLQNSKIQGSEALVEKPVVAFENSIAAYVGTEKNMHIVEVDNVDTAIDYLKEDRVIAYIDDYPLLQDYINKNPNAPYFILPYGFHYIDYGIEFRRESELTKEFNVALVKFIEGGEYEQLNKSWSFHIKG